jgi:hypothetical protein
MRPMWVRIECLQASLLLKRGRGFLAAPLGEGGKGSHRRSTHSHTAGTAGAAHPTARGDRSPAAHSSARASLPRPASLPPGGHQSPVGPRSIISLLRLARAYPSATANRGFVRRLLSTLRFPSSSGHGRLFPGDHALATPPASACNKPNGDSPVGATTDDWRMQFDSSSQNKQTRALASVGKCLWRRR